MGSEDFLPIFLGQGLIAVVFGLGVLVRELARGLKEVRDLLWQHLQDRHAHH